MDYPAKLAEFYSKANIGGGNNDAFACQFRESCHDGIDGSIWMGSDTHVGSEYGEPYRIVVLSLDRGEGSANLTDRRSEIEGDDGSNPHMKGTMATLHAILNPGERDNSVFRRFAMVNAAKCTPKDASMNMAPAQFFEYCTPHILKEMRILAPQIIVTQGAKAKASIGRHLNPHGKSALRTLNSMEKEQVKLIMVDLVGQEMIDTYFRGFTENIWTKYLFRYALDSEDIYALCPTHPSERFGRWKMFQTTYLPILGKICDTLVRKQYDAE